QGVPYMQVVHNSTHPVRDVFPVYAHGSLVPIEVSPVMHELPCPVEQINVGSTLRPFTVSTPQQGYRVTQPAVVPTGLKPCINQNGFRHRSPTPLRDSPLFGQQRSTLTQCRIYRGRPQPHCTLYSSIRTGHG